MTLLFQKFNLLKNLFYQLFVTAISRIVGLFNSVYAIKTLGSYNIGLTSLIQTSVSQTSILYDGSLNNVGLRKIIESNDKNFEIAFRIISFRLMVGLLCSILWLIVIFVIKPEHYLIWCLGAIGIILNCLDVSFLYRALNKFNLYITIYSLIPIISAICYRILLKNSSQTGLDYIIYISSSILSILILNFYIVKDFGYSVIDIFNIGEHKKLLSTNKELWISASIGILYPSLQIFLISYLLGLRENGIYKASLIFIAPFELINSLLSGMVLPLLTKWKSLGVVLFKKKVNKLFISIFLTLVPILIISLLLPSSFFEKLLGKNFTSSISVFKIAIVGKIILLSSTPYIYSIIANRHDNLNLNFTIINSLVNLLLCIILIPKFGIFGAAFSMMICEILMCILCFYNFLKINQINY